MRSLLFLFTAAVCAAQSVSNGHLHLLVTNMDTSRKFFVDTLGGKPVMLGNMEIVKFPGVYIALRAGTSTSGSEPTVIGHVGLKVPNMPQAVAKWRAAGVKFFAPPAEGAKQVFILSPDNVKIEMSEEAAMAEPIANHHIHFYTASVDETKAWYVKMFGAAPGKRGRFEAADLPGVNLTFSAAEKPTTPTKGTALDHIGFEVKGLQAFCKKLEGQGISFEVPYRDMPALGIHLAFLVDPWGTRIELTEGLAGK